MREWLYLHWLNLYVSIWNFFEYCRVIGRYYVANPHFMRDDLSLIRRYAFRSPYKISRDFLISQGAQDPHTYGETPLTTLQSIADAAHIGPQDHVYELGCGRGRTCIWLSHFRRCRVTALEYIPTFIELSSQIETPNIDWRIEDFTQTDYSDATVIYLSGTCLDEPTIRQLAQRIEETASPGTRIVTVSYPLSDYAKSKSFKLVAHLNCPFVWGQAGVYIQTL